MVELTSLADKLDHPEAILEKAAEVGQETTLNLISRGFKRGEDPYGKPWDAPNNLQITGGIKSYTKGKTSSSGWSVHATDEKAIWHHDPQPRANWKDNKSLPQRLQVPTDERGWPPQWEKRINKAIERALKVLLT